MKVYLASRYSRREEMNNHAAVLREIGHTVDCRWLLGDHQILDGEDVSDRSVQLAVDDYEDVQAAEVVVVFSEPPRTPTRGGRLVEFGIALGMRKHVIVVGPLECVFCHLPQVSHYDTWRQALHAEFVDVD